MRTARIAAPWAGGGRFLAWVEARTPTSYRAPMNVKYSCLVLTSGLTLAACASSSSTTMTDTAAVNIKGEEVQYSAGGTVLNGYLAYNADQSGPRPGVLVVHEWWGHDEYARNRARMLAEMGYTALALDMYGDGKHADHPNDAQKFMTEVTSNMDVGVARFRAAMDVLQKQDTTDATKIAAIGYCFGGAVVLHMARIGTPLAGVASFHGSLSTQNPADSGTLTASILVAHGADDPLIPDDQVSAFKSEMEGAGADLTFVAYPGAKHSFTNPMATERGKKFEFPALEYQEEADKKSWAELDAFLKRVFAQ